MRGTDLNESHPYVPPEPSSNAIPTFKPGSSRQTLIHNQEEIDKLRDALISSQQNVQAHSKAVHNIANFKEQLQPKWHEYVTRYFDESVQAKFQLLSEVNSLNREINVRILNGSNQGYQALCKLNSCSSSEVKLMNQFIDKQDVEGLRELLRQNPTLSAYKSYYEKPPLQRALETGNHNLVKVLLDAGANVNNTFEVEMAGWRISTSPFMYALYRKDFEMAELLAKQGTNPLYKSISGMSNIYKQINYPMKAVLESDAPIDVKRQIIKALAQNLRKDNEAFRELIFEVVDIEGGHEILQVLGVNPSELTTDGMYLRRTALRYGNPACVRYVLKQLDDKGTALTWRDFDNINENLKSFISTRSDIRGELTQRLNAFLRNPDNHRTIFKKGSQDLIRSLIQSGAVIKADDLLYLAENYNISGKDADSLTDLFRPNPFLDRTFAQQYNIRTEIGNQEKQKRDQLIDKIDKAYNESSWKDYFETCMKDLLALDIDAQEEVLIRLNIEKHTRLKTKVRNARQ